MHLYTKYMKKELAKVAISKPQDHKLLRTARTLQWDQKVKCKTVTKTATLAGDRQEADSFKKCEENFCKSFSSTLSFLHLPTVHLSKETVRFTRKSSEEWTREFIHRIALQTKESTSKGAFPVAYWGSRLLCSG